eukprot:7941145-Alexandrium_andersonii.AAC.1
MARYSARKRWDLDLIAPALLRWMRTARMRSLHSPSFFRVEAILTRSSSPSSSSRPAIWSALAT